jgi:hypothetical protein
MFRYFGSTVMMQRLVIPAVLASCVLEAGLKAADLWIYNGSGELNKVLSYAAIAALCENNSCTRFDGRHL